MSVPATVRRLPKAQPRIDPGHRPEIDERTRYESLRDLAAEYGVSHETFRAIARRATRTRLTAS